MQVIDDTKNIREGLYKSLYEVRNKGCEPKAFYLGFNWLKALDEITRVENGYYGTRMAKFCDVPIYEVVGDPYHFFLAVKVPWEKKQYFDDEPITQDDINGTSNNRGLGTAA